MISNSARRVLAALRRAAGSLAPPVRARRARMPTPTPSPTPTPIADPAITQLARQQFVAWQAGIVNKSLYVAAGAREAYRCKDRRDVSQALGQLGRADGHGLHRALGRPELPAGRARLHLPDAAASTATSTCGWRSTAQGKIATIFFKEPARRRDGYARPRRPNTVARPAEDRRRLARRGIIAGRP